MKKEVVIAHHRQQIDKAQNILEFLDSIHLKAVYKVSFLAKRYNFVTDENGKKKWTIVESGIFEFLGMPITISKVSVRFMVLAADEIKDRYGRITYFDMNDDKEKWHTRKDTITLRYEDLLDAQTSLETPTPEDFPLYLGRKFVHRDFRKHMEKYLEEA